MSWEDASTSHLAIVLPASWRGLSATLWQIRAAAAGSAQLAQRCAAPGGLPSRSERWDVQALPVSSQLLEYIPGRDRLLQAPDLAAGLDAIDASSGEHMLCTLPLPAAALSLATPLLLRCCVRSRLAPWLEYTFLRGASRICSSDGGARALQLWQSGELPECTDGRLSAGPVDMAAFLAQPPVREAVKQALHRCSFHMCLFLILLFADQSLHVGIVPACFAGGG